MYLEAALQPAFIAASLSAVAVIGFALRKRSLTFVVFIATLCLASLLLVLGWWAAGDDLTGKVVCLQIAHFLLGVCAVGSLFDRLTWKNRALICVGLGLIAVSWLLQIEYYRWLFDDSLAWQCFNPHPFFEMIGLRAPNPMSVIYWDLISGQRPLSLLSLVDN